jgi:hypothetical protein
MTDDPDRAAPEQQAAPARAPQPPEVYFDSDVPADAEPVGGLAEGAVYDPAEDREKVRGRIAGGLVALLAVLTLVPTAAVIFGTSADDLKTILEVVLPPVVALCGSALGFYYGAGQGSR